jgi:hypothetical protein
LLDTGTAVEEPQYWNRYQYGLNNPLRFVDPDGRFPWAVIGAAAVTWYFYEAILNAPNDSSQLAADVTIGSLFKTTVVSGITGAFGRVFSGIIGRGVTTATTMAVRAGVPKTGHDVRTMTKDLKVEKPGISSVKSEKELDTLFGNMTTGASKTATKKDNYPGTMMQLPDGTTVGMRTTAKSTGTKAIDIKFTNGETLKVHVNPGKGGL